MIFRAFDLRRKKKCAGLDENSEYCQGEDNCANGNDTIEQIDEHEEDEQSPFFNMQSLPIANISSHEQLISSSLASNQRSLTNK